MGRKLKNHHSWAISTQQDKNLSSKPAAIFKITLKTLSLEKHPLYAQCHFLQFSWASVFCILHVQLFNLYFSESHFFWHSTTGLVTTTDFSLILLGGHCQLQKCKFQTCFSHLSAFVPHDAK